VCDKYDMAASMKSFVSCWMTNFGEPKDVLSLQKLSSLAFTMLLPAEFAKYTRLWALEATYDVSVGLKASRLQIEVASMFSFG
jgi:hypothetical protein